MPVCIFFARGCCNDSACRFRHEIRASVSQDCGTGLVSQRTSALQSASHATQRAVPFNYKTVMCTYYQEGLCKRGSKCTFAHELTELRLLPAYGSAPAALPQPARMQQAMPHVQHPAGGISGRTAGGNNDSASVPPLDAFLVALKANHVEQASAISRTLLTANDDCLYGCIATAVVDLASPEMLQIVLDVRRPRGWPDRLCADALKKEGVSLALRPSNMRL